MRMELEINGSPIALEQVVRSADGVTFVLHGKAYCFRCRPLPDGSALLEQEISAGVWRRISAAVWPVNGGHQVQLPDGEAMVSPVKKVVAQGVGSAGAIGGAVAPSRLNPVAPMPGLIRQILVQVGEVVTLGQPLLVMEAMKLQTTLAASGDGVVTMIHVSEGAVVIDGAELMKLRFTDKQ
jgi:biotin carboxyl carrier protein